MSTGFKADCWLCIIVAGFLQLWPSPAVQAAVNIQMQSGYVAGWVRN